MKINPILFAGALALTATVSADVAPAIPIGSIDVNQLTVRQGVAPTFNWQIQYPEVVTDVVDITPDDEIIPITKLRVRVSMIGAGITDQKGRQYPAKVAMKFGASSWEHIFTGSGAAVRPDNVIIDRIVQPGEILQYAAKVNLSGYDYYYNNSSNIRVLKNGDTPPNIAAGYSIQTSVADYLRPYIKDGKIALGPMDVIYVSELTHSDQSHVGFDIQDSITLVRFEKVTE